MAHPYLRATYMLSIHDKMLLVRQFASMRPPESTWRFSWTKKLKPYPNGNERTYHQPCYSCVSFPNSYISTEEKGTRAVDEILALLKSMAKLPSISVESGFYPVTNMNFEPGFKEGTETGIWLGAGELLISGSGNRHLSFPPHHTMREREGSSNNLARALG